jgi:hypothetical protein
VHAHNQKLVLVVKMATELQEYSTEEKRSSIRFSVTNRTRGKECLSHKTVDNWVQNRVKRFADE